MINNIEINNRQLSFKLHLKKENKSSIYPKFKEIFSKAFDQHYFKEIFDWKYLSTFSESSFLQEITFNRKTIGFRGLWRVKNYPSAFQCIDTCLDPDYQGKGIFKKSNDYLIKQLGYFYNYPNTISSPGYLKSGWTTYAPMNLYLNKINNFEFCDWDQDFLNWRFSKHPYIKYYKTKIKEGYAIVRFKKGFPVHVESTRYNIDLQKTTNPIYSFKYDIKKNGLKIKNAGNILGYNFNGVLRSSHFDMI